MLLQFIPTVVIFVIIVVIVIVYSNSRVNKLAQKLEHAWNMVDSATLDSYAHQHHGRVTKSYSFLLLLLLLLP